jgi:hypothetical protein
VEAGRVWLRTFLRTVEGYTHLELLVYAVLTVDRLIDVDDPKWKAAFSEPTDLQAEGRVDPGVEMGVEDAMEAAIDQLCGNGVVGMRDPHKSEGSPAVADSYKNLVDSYQASRTLVICVVESATRLAWAADLDGLLERYECAGLEDRLETEIVSGALADELEEAG